MPTSFLARDDHERNPLTTEQRDEAERAALGGPPASSETMRALLFELDCHRLEICEWVASASRDELRRVGGRSYYGPSHAADDRKWGYIFVES